jgi:hypothetical protein
MSAALRLFASTSRVPSRSLVASVPRRSLHSPFKGGPGAAASAPASRLSDVQADEFYDSESPLGSRTHVVSPQALTFNQIPLGAYPVSTPYPVNPDTLRDTSKSV